LDVAQSTVCMWERGKNLPRGEILPKLAMIYNCTVDELLSGQLGMEE